MTQGEKIVEMEQRIKFLEKTVYGLIWLVVTELMGLFVFWVKDILKL